MIRILKLVALLLVSTSLFVSDGTFAAARSGGASALFESALANYQQGADARAISQFTTYVRAYGTSPRVDEASLYLARIYQRQRRCDQALQSLSRIPENRRSPSVDLIEGVCAVQQGQAQIGLQRLRTLFNANLPAHDQRLFYSTLFRAERDRGRLIPALAFAWRALQSPGDHTDLLREAHTVLENRLSERELAEVRFMFADSAIGQDAGLQLARLALARQDQPTARLWLSRVLNSTVDFPYRADAHLLMARVDGTLSDADVDRNTVGVLLPLSGRFERFGRMVKRGMDLALQLHNKNHRPLRLIYKDSQADPGVSLRQMNVLTQEARVMAIAGPLTGAAAEQVAQRAQIDRVPLLTLSQKKGLPQTGSFIFRNSLTPTLQARALARFAVQEQGLRTFGVFYPENSFGRGFLSLFTQEVERFGGRVVATEPYAESATDFRDPIERLFGSSIQTERAPFDALFIPDYADTVAMIAPQLAFYGLKGTTLLGINGWNTPELIERAGKFVNGAIFVDGFFRSSNKPFVKEFIDLYTKTYEEAPSILEAQAFDSAGILFYLLDRPDIFDRERLQQALMTLRDYPGVTGATSFNAAGEAQKSLFLLQVQKGAIVQIN